MDNRKILLYIGITFFFCACGELNNPKERNTLCFENKIENVSYEIDKMNSILDITNKQDFIFGVDEENILFVMDSTQKIKDVGLITDTLLFRNKLLSFIDLDQRKLFIKSVCFLAINSLTRCNKEKGNYLYLYRANIYMADKQKDLMRYVILAKDITDLNLNKYKILDHKDDLYLLADKNAEIWEN